MRPISHERSGRKEKSCYVGAVKNLVREKKTPGQMEREIAIEGNRGQVSKE